MPFSQNLKLNRLSAEADEINRRLSTAPINLSSSAFVVIQIDVDIGATEQVNLRLTTAVSYLDRRLTPRQHVEIVGRHRDVGRSPSDLRPRPVSAMTNLYCSSLDDTRPGLHVDPTCGDIH